MVDATQNGIIRVRDLRPSASNENAGLVPGAEPASVGRAALSVVSIEHRSVVANGIRIHFAEAGDGPLVILCHGFPESWYSWRHQLGGLAAAGYRVIAPDMRGYGRSDRPADPIQYTLLHLVGDVAALVGAAGQSSAVIVGHDWGAAVAWHAALLRPDVFRAVAALSVPYRPRGRTQPTLAMPQNETALFYQLYFQEPGVAEAELERDVRNTMRALLVGLSGDGRSAGGQARGLPAGMVSRAEGLLAGLPDSPPLPAWLNDEDLDFYVSEFTRTGFAGGLNWYRNIDRNWEQLSDYSGATIPAPALFLAGARDPVLAFPGVAHAIAGLAQSVPLLRSSLIIPGAGHWIQQERAEEVNAALLDFLRTQQ
jgi:pimeloyl-ACP methyl ester carboxylesterase